MAAIWGAAIAGGASLVGGLLSNDSERTRAHEAQDFSAEQYATRWQTTTRDMQAAGLNPMLAYSQGVGQSPSGVKANYTDPLTPAVNAGLNAYDSVTKRQATSAQIANVEADTKNKEAQADLIDAQAAAAWASAGQSNASIKQIDATTAKIVEETKNVPLEGDRLRAVITNTAAQTGLTETNEISQRLSWPQIQAITKKVLNEVGLTSLDLEAAKNLDNFGRNAKELKPLIDLVKTLLSHELRK